MADNFKAFMAENAIKYNEVEYVASERFVDENGKPIPWRFRILTEAENNKIRNQCIRRVTDAKTRQTTTEVNRDKYNDMLIEKCVIYPNLNDAALQESYGAVGAVELAKTMLMPGEYTDLILAVDEANDFESGMAEKIRRVKN